MIIFYYVMVSSIKDQRGVFFFTVALADRTEDLLVRHVDRLRRMYQAVHARHPFETIAICILPDHIHAVWSLPTGDRDYAGRWSLIKSSFSRGSTTMRRVPEARSGSEKKACGSAAIGNARSAMMQTQHAMLTTFISIRSSTDTFRGYAIGRTAASTGTWRRAICRPTGRRHESERR
jgi:REP element-mobilizing transposase RayT